MELCPVLKIYRNIIEKLLDKSNQKYDWNIDEFEIICQIERHNKLKNWGEKRKVVSNYLHQEKSDNYGNEMIEWEKQNPKPL